MAGKRKGKIVLLHLSFQYPFAGVVWQLIHHLVGFRQLGLDVYYIEDNKAYVYDPSEGTPVADSSRNVARVGRALDRFGFAGKWSFLDSVSQQHIGMSRKRSHELLREADAVINLCGATAPREEHIKSRCLVYLETDPGILQVKLIQRDEAAKRYAEAHNLFFTYGYNIGSADCALPSAGIEWHPTRPPVLLEEWRPAVGRPEPATFTTVGTWRNKGNDVEIGGQQYFWSKHVNFAKVLNVAKRANQAIELAMDLYSGSDFERAKLGGFSFIPATPMSLDVDQYRTYVSSSRGEFTVAKDLYVRTRSGWFSDRTVCYMAAGRPVVTQGTGFEKFVPTGKGLLSFDDCDSAVWAIAEVNRDYAQHSKAARTIAREYFSTSKLLGEVADLIGL
jgi:hypothetical protein